MQETAWRLEQLFYPIQEVRAIPSHDPQGNLNGTAVSVNANTTPLEGRKGAHAVDVIVTSDESKSENAPYSFRIHAFATFVMEVAEADPSLAATAVFTMLVGAIRERLASLTSRGPWAVFQLQPVTFKQDAGPGNEPDQVGQASTANPST
jgi:preprotein translocase subunit SecB